eukprot:CAMPEP_0206263796 /NCGR_PEP_ID=MMETSP0047_2-20121206/29031_1 /ASSEMBLY_ACC=CAM_ASM_000192 /TAXON_ID=195065 /ORGANISM="Chroomonas mesostigmatica_cf, Strain CCMP1168" /LENGTH=184 /DNA_ID=CAMNT_0053691405 /DNA_START=58 /DNA_END=613 /DNA_ORIENTATION=-
MTQQFYTDISTINMMRDSIQDLSKTADLYFQYMSEFGSIAVDLFECFDRETFEKLRTVRLDGLTSAVSALGGIRGLRAEDFDFGTQQAFVSLVSGLMSTLLRDQSMQEIQKIILNQTSQQILSEVQAARAGIDAAIAQTAPGSAARTALEAISLDPVSISAQMDAQVPALNQELATPSQASSQD